MKDFHEQLPVGEPDKEITRLKAKLSEKEKEMEIYKDKALRSIADLANFTKKSRENMEEFMGFANAELIIKFLPVLDSFEIALKKDSGTKDKTSLKNFHSGIELIYKNIINLLDKEGLKKQDVIDKKFDPLLHEVVGSIEVEGEDDIIIEEVRSGYILNGRVIRHAMVKVSKKKQKEQENLNQE